MISTSNSLRDLKKFIGLERTTVLVVVAAHIFQDKETPSIPENRINFHFGGMSSSANHKNIIYIKSSRYREIT